MTLIRDMKELCSVLGSVFPTVDPIADLKSADYTFAPAIADKVDTPAMRARFASPERRRLVNRLRGPHNVRFQAGPLPLVAARLPGNHYDLTLGVRLEKASEVLADAYAKLFLPHVVSLPLKVSADSLHTLLTVLRTDLTGVPPGTDVSIGDLHFSAPPTVTALPTPAPSDGSRDRTARVLVHQSIVLDLDRVDSTGLRQRAITTLRAVASFGLAVSAQVNTATLVLSLAPIPGHISVGDPEFLRIEISQASPLQPRSPSSADQIALTLELGGFQGVLRDIATSTTITPNIQLPLGEGLDIQVSHIDLRAVPNESAGHLMIGVELGAGPLETPPPNYGDPSLLERNPFENAMSTLYVEAHIELFRLLVRQAYTSGDLQRLAQKRKPNVIIKGAEAELGTNFIGLWLQGTAVDECGFFGLDFKDVDFDGSTSYQLEGVTNGRIYYHKLHEIGTGDAHGGDALACILMGFLDLHIIPILLEAAAGQVGSWIFGEGNPIHDSIPIIFKPNFPIPGTELLPSIRALSASIDSTAIRIEAALDFAPDNVNTYIYVRVEQASSPRIDGPAVGIPGARVRLFDQDVPRPKDDDTEVPEESTRTHWNIKFRTTIETAFQPPLADEQLAEGRTDGNARVQLVLSPGAVVTTAGIETTTTITEYSNPRQEDAYNQEQQSLLESKPDVYFVIDLPDGSHADTRSMPGGFVLNLDTKHLGTALAPMRFTLPMHLTKPPDNTLFESRS